MGMGATAGLEFEAYLVDKLREHEAAVDAASLEDVDEGLLTHVVKEATIWQRRRHANEA